MHVVLCQKHVWGERAFISIIICRLSVHESRKMPSWHKCFYLKRFVCSAQSLAAGRRPVICSASSTVYHPTYICRLLLCPHAMRSATHINYPLPNLEDHVTATQTPPSYAHIPSNNEHFHVHQHITGTRRPTPKSTVPTGRSSMYIPSEQP